MKKIFAICAALLCAANMVMADGSYGIAVNGKMYYAGAENPSPQDPSFKEFMVLGLSLNAGDNFQLWDPSANDGKGVGWAVDLDKASVEGMTRDGDHYVCANAGCYDFYIKLKYQADQLYIGKGECGTPTGTPISGEGGGQGGGQGGGGTEADAYWYWKGSVDGVDVNNEIDGGIFDCGISEISVKEGAHLFVMYQVKGVPGVQYMSAAYENQQKHVTMTKTGNEKLFVPAGDHTLYLYDNGDGTVELSYEPLAGKKLMDGGQGIENPMINEKARKVFIDGQLRIIRGNKMFDATGREL